MKTTPTPPPGSVSLLQTELFPVDTLTPAVWSTSNPAIYVGMAIAISSPESQDGQKPSGSRSGRKTRKSGPAHVPVSPSASSVNKAAAKIIDISGPSSGGSSPSANLQRSLENRLRKRLAAYGSPEYALTWKNWDMPAGGADLCAAGVSAPHIRQRLYWGAHRLGITSQPRLEGHTRNVYNVNEGGRLYQIPIGPAAASGFWDDYELARCRDGKTRRVKSGLLCVAYGFPSDLVRGSLRGFGNAISPQLAAEFICAFRESIA